ncbi:hypothetical protein E2320_007432, partial [Naja naja]
CHESCATCRGPTANNCSTCRDPSLVFLEGTCVANCGQRFYVTEGVCRAVQDLCPLSVPPAPSPRPSTTASVSSLVERAFISTTTSVKCMNPEEKLQPYLSLEERPVGTCLPQCRAQFYSDKDRICKGERRSLLSQSDN